MKITNTNRGPRGLNAVQGKVWIEPGETVDIDVFEREKAEIEASGWFEVDGDYTANPGGPAGTSDLATRAAEIDLEIRRMTQVRDDRIAELEALLAKREKEIAELRAASESKAVGEGEEPEGLDREELKKQAGELEIEFPRNIATEKLKELIDAKLAE